MLMEMGRISVSRSAWFEFLFYHYLLGARVKFPCNHRLRFPAVDPTRDSHAIDKMAMKLIMAVIV